MHNRTFDQTDNTKLFMNFTKNESLGFRNFDECYNHWFDLSEKYVGVEIDEIFQIDPRKKKKLNGKGKHGEKFGD